ncbi:MAG: hypothetical protein NVS1B14_10280 [Vulcanimicrobiaceae bacterium]
MHRRDARSADHAGKRTLLAYLTAVANDMKAGPADRAVLLIQAQDALKMHFIWMKRGYDFLEGHAVNLPAGFARNDDLCPVGNWLRARLDPRFRGLPLFARTNALHEEFHIALDELFAQDIKHVASRTAERFHQVGDDLTRCLEEWVELAKNASPDWT